MAKQQRLFYRGDYSVNFLRSGVAEIKNRETGKLVHLCMKSDIKLLPAFIELKA